LRKPSALDQNVDLVLNDPFDNLLCAVARYVGKVVSLSLDFESVGGLVARRRRVTEDVETIPIVEAEDALHQMRERMVAEVARDVADVDLAVDWWTRWRVDDGRKPGLVESRVRDS
jgi:hypothetical protein